VIALGVGVVGVKEVGKNDLSEPLDGLKTVGLGHDHADGAAPRTVEPLAIEFVAKDHRRQIEWILEHAADRQRAAEHLLRIIVMKAGVKYQTQILTRLRKPDHLAEGHPFPDTHAERASDVQTGHYFRKPDGMF